MQKFIKKNGFVLCMFYLYILLCVIVALGIDPYFKALGANNVVIRFLELLRLPIENTGPRALGTFAIFLGLTALYVTFMIYEFRTNKEVKGNKKWGFIVGFFVLYALMNVIIFLGLFMHNHSYLISTLIFSGEVLLIALIAFLLLAVILIIPVVLIYYSAKNDTTDIEKVECELKKELVFPGLTEIDREEENNTTSTTDTDVTLDTLVEQFRNYLAKEEKLYFDIKTVRTFIAALSASHLIILEGLSGTGKSSIARCFSDFIGEKSFFAPVQTTWRDKTSILGFFNDFSKSYNETEFLKRLYRTSYHENNVNIMVLDEMNISRIEYYFADFLSIMEYPQKDWQVNIMQLPYNFIAPKHLENGFLKIPANTWFIGTANKDDSTYTITDKVYDRAMTLSFDDRNEPFEINEEASICPISYSKLNNLFAEALNAEEYKLTEEDLNKFKELTNFTYDTFELTFGNRIMNQIIKFTPVYIACGGIKEEALDFMFARKVLAKLEGRFEDYIKKGLLDLSKLIKKLYGDDLFKESQATINHLLRRF